MDSIKYWINFKIYMISISFIICIAYYIYYYVKNKLLLDTIISFIASIMIIYSLFTSISNNQIFNSIKHDYFDKNKSVVEVEYLLYSKDYDIKNYSVNAFNSYFDMYYHDNHKKITIEKFIYFKNEYCNHKIDGFRCGLIINMEKNEKFILH